MSRNRENTIEKKSFDFALRVINLHKHLYNEKREFCISKQILRSGTSIGANIAEGKYAESALDFIHKLAIAQKETSETLYWIELLYAADYISEKEYESLLFDCTEIIKLLTTIIKTKKSALKQNANNN
ncbi:four helix bundle protein [Paludibacter sp. 221]|uniref:four helix bundle protein n=1 Tax=Paludibacter sp. 221 TaxID=2302939 RepID=UPI0013D42CCB|nr:four helix bundle protein [Paludibacter sp. 221]NDV47085.1 four helix bundle protein [Paludibacter sp. 221]